MGILSVVGYMVHRRWGYEMITIGMSKYERCAQDWFSFANMDPPHNVTYEEVIGAYRITAYSNRIKYNIIKINTFDRQGWMPCSYGSTSSGLPGRFSYTS